jgi:hypothetical protein
MKDLANQRFGKLVALYPIRKQGTSWVWVCKCDCGKEKEVASRHLANGDTVSCGCHRRSILNHATHNQSRTRLYSVWAGMKKRCSNPHSANYSNYGLRGIRICDEWITFEPFMEWAIANGYKDGLQIDRINNNGDYCPSNCHFVTPKENSRNRSTTIFVEINGESKTLTEIAKLANVTTATISYRYKKGLRGNDLIAPAKYNGKGCDPSHA